MQVWNNVLVSKLRLPQDILLEHVLPFLSLPQQGDLRLVCKQMCILVDAYFPRKEYKSVKRVLKDILILSPHPWMLQTLEPHYQLSHSQLRNIIQCLGDAPFLRLCHDEMETLLEVAIKLRLESLLRDKVNSLSREYIKCDDFLNKFENEHGRIELLNLIERSKNDRAAETRRKIFFDRYYEFLVSMSMKYAHQDLYLKLVNFQGDTSEDMFIIYSLFYKDDVTQEKEPSLEFLQERRQVYYRMMKEAAKKIFFTAKLLDADVLMMQLLSGHGDLLVKFQGDPEFTSRFHGGQLIRYVDLDMIFGGPKSAKDKYTPALQARFSDKKNLASLFRFMFLKFRYSPRPALFKMLMKCGQRDVVKVLWEGFEVIIKHQQESLEKNPKLKMKAKRREMESLKQEHLQTWDIVMILATEVGDDDIFKFMLARCPDDAAMKRAVPGTAASAVSNGNVAVFDIVYAKYSYMFGAARAVRLAPLHKRAEASCNKAMIEYLDRLFEAKSQEQDMDHLADLLKSGAQLDAIEPLVEPYVDVMDHTITLSTEEQVVTGEWLLSVAVAGGDLKVVKHLHEHLKIPFNYQAVRHLSRCSKDMIRYVLTRANPFKIVTEETKGSCKHNAHQFFKQYRNLSCYTALRYAYIARQCCGNEVDLPIEKIVFDCTAWINEEFLDAAMEYALHFESEPVLEWVAREQVRFYKTEQPCDIQHDILVDLIDCASVKLVKAFFNVFPAYQVTMDECLFLFESIAETPCNIERAQWMSMLTLLQRNADTDVKEEIADQVAALFPSLL